MYILTNMIQPDATEVFQSIEDIKNVNPGVIETYLKGLVPDVIAFLIQVLVAVIVYLIGTQIIRLARKLLKKWLVRREADTGVRQFLDALCKYICYFILIMMILSVFGIATTSAIALLGSAGLTIGLALQGSLSNFAGGVLILLLKPFRVGDYIVEDTNKNEGTVKEISVFYTKLSTIDNRIVIIPNGILANSSLTNVTQSSKRRIDLYVDISYSSDLKKAKELLKELAQKDESRLQEEPVDVFVSDLEDSSVKLGLRLWVTTTDYWETRWRLTESIKLEFDRNGIEIPFPQMGVTVKNV